MSLIFSQLEDHSSDMKDLCKRHRPTSVHIIFYWNRAEGLMKVKGSRVHRIRWESRHVSDTLQDIWHGNYTGH